MSLENQHVHDHFLVTLLKAYGPPQREQVDGFMEIYARMLRQYVPSELQAAAEQLLKTHKGPHRWPRIPECVAACEDVRERLRAQDWVKKHPKVGAVAKPEKTPEEKAKSQQFVIDCAEGRIELGFCAHLLRDLAKQIRRREGF